MSTVVQSVLSLAVVDQPAECDSQSYCAIEQGRVVTPEAPLVRQSVEDVGQMSDPPNAFDSRAKRMIKSKRTISCPPREKRSAVSGLWSLEWLTD